MYTYRPQLPNLNVASNAMARFTRPEKLTPDLTQITVNLGPLQEYVPGDLTPENSPVVNAVWLSAVINLDAAALLVDDYPIKEALTLSTGEFRSLCHLAEIDQTSMYDVVGCLNAMLSPFDVEYTLSRVGDWEQIQLIMMEGNTVMVGGTAYESFAQAQRTGVVPMPKPGEGLLGGHIVNLVSIDREQETAMAFANMGREFGHRGRLKFRDAYLRNLSICRDFFVLIPKGVTHGV